VEHGSWCRISLYSYPIMIAAYGYETSKAELCEQIVGQQI